MKTIFLDRDGVLNPLLETSEEKVSPQNLEEFKLFDGVEEAIRQAKAAGFMIIVFTNQPDVEKSWRELNEEKIESINDFIKETGVEAVYTCNHGPIGSKDNKRYRKKGEIVVCDCRKPQPGLIEKATRDYSISFSSSYVIGDNYRDLEAASRYEEKHSVNFNSKFSIGKDLENADRTFDNVNTAIGKIIEDDRV